MGLFSTYLIALGNQISAAKERKAKEAAEKEKAEADDKKGEDSKTGKSAEEMAQVMTLDGQPPNGAVPPGRILLTAPSEPREPPASNAQVPQHLCTYRF